MGIGYGGMSRRRQIIAGSFGQRLMEDSLQEHLQTPDEVHHFPIVRNLPVGWHQNARGNWTFDELDQLRFEVVCAACGDDEGPAELQSEEVRQLRGPYDSAREARRVRKEHLGRARRSGRARGR